MRLLKIKNVGPIKNVEIELTKINVIIGPQSSGKSTINKIACYLSWVEKKVCLDQSFDFFYADRVFLTNLEVFHKLEGYIDFDSLIEYESDVLIIKYEHKISQKDKYSVPNFKWKNQYGYKRPKISYIPAERNVISVIPNWMDVTLPDNNIRNYMTDWNVAHNMFDKENPLNIKSLKVEYFYDEKKQSDTILFEDNDNEIRPIGLTNASSGVQSVVPIYALIYYFLDVIKKGKGEIQSISETNKNRTLRKKLSQELAKNLADTMDDSSLKDYVSKLNEIKVSLNSIKKNMDGKRPFSQVDKELIEQFNILSQTLAFQDSFGHYTVIKNFTRNWYLDLFLEEPESNLFPSTQKELLYFLIEKTLEIDDSSLMLTTHSPFILYALNNCIMGGMISKNIEQEVAAKFESYKAWIDPNKVSVWEIHDGELKDIKDKKLNVIGQHYFNNAMGDTLGEYSKMLKYFKR